MFILNDWLRVKACELRILANVANAQQLSGVRDKLKAAASELECELKRREAADNDRT